MSRRYSVAEARASLPSILDEVEGGAGVELTRRGKPVAVVLSIDEYERLRGERSSFKDAFGRFARQHRIADAGLDRDFARNVRDRSAGRKVSL